MWRDIKGFGVECVENTVYVWRGTSVEIVVVGRRCEWMNLVFRSWTINRDDAPVVVFCMKQPCFLGLLFKIRVCSMGNSRCDYFEYLG